MKTFWLKRIVWHREANENLWKSFDGIKATVTEKNGKCTVRIIGKKTDEDRHVLINCHEEYAASLNI